MEDEAAALEEALRRMGWDGEADRIGWNVADISWLRRVHNIVVNALRFRPTDLELQHGPATQTLLEAAIDRCTST